MTAQPKSANAVIPIEFARAKKSPKVRYFMARVDALLDYLGRDFERYGRLNERVRGTDSERRDIWSEHFAMEDLVSEEVGPEALRGQVVTEQGDALSSDSLVLWWEGRMRAALQYYDDADRRAAVLGWGAEEAKRLYGDEGPKNHWALLAIFEKRVLDDIRAADARRGHAT